MGSFISKYRKPTIHVLTLNGIISSNNDGLSIKRYNKLIEETFRNMSPKNELAIIINSPGGSPVQTEFLYRRIHTLAKEKNIHISVFVEDVAASGGYYLALIGDSIYASNSSIIGSIGVIAGGFGFQELISKIGVERRLYTQGTNKSILDPFMPEQEKDVKILNDVMKDVHDEFIRHVMDHRGVKLKYDNEPDMFTGKFWSGKQAKELGLIDDIGNINSIYDAKYGYDKYTLKYIKENKSLLSSLKESFGIIAHTFVQQVIQGANEQAVTTRYNSML